MNYLAQVPVAFTLLFLTSVAYAWLCVYKASGRNTVAMAIPGLFLATQGFLCLRGFYSVYDSFPPRLFFLVGPAVLVMVGVLWRTRKNPPISSETAKWFLLLHLVRIPVEICLWALHQSGLVPISMTWEGANPDILSGLSALLVFYLFYIRQTLSLRLRLYWNGFGLMLLFNVVIRGILSAPGPLQQLAFDQPNVGVTLFPFVYLPGFVVPLVMYAHFQDIRFCLSGKKG